MSATSRSLHARVVLGYAYLATLALLAAVSAAYGFWRLSAASTARAVDDGEALDALVAAAHQQAVLYGLLAVVALVSFALLSRGLRGRLLDRLEELAAVAGAVAEGDTARRARVEVGDELGTVARQLNAVLDERQATENRARGRLAAQRQVTLGLLAERPEPSALLGLGGEVLASTLDDALTDQLRSPDNETSASLRAALDGEGDARRFALDDRTARLRPLNTAAGRPVGFLVEVSGESGDGGRPVAGGDRVDARRLTS